MRRPSFFQVTFTLGVPANETSSLSGFPFSQETSRSFFTKWTGSDRSKAVVSLVSSPKRFGPAPMVDSTNL